MGGLSDENGNYLSPEQILVLSETVEGRRKVKRYILMARTAYSVQEILSYLQNEVKIFTRVLSPTEQQTLCNVLFCCLFEVDQSVICDYVEQIHEHFKDTDLDLLHNEMGNA
jgi:hypothetical protein